MVPSRGESYRDIEGLEWEVVAVDGAITSTVTLQPKGGGEQKVENIADFRAGYSFVHPGAAERGYES